MCDWARSQAEPWLRPIDPLPLGTSTHIEFCDVGSTFSDSFYGMVQCTPVFTGHVLPARTVYTSVTCAACSMMNEMATTSEGFQLAIGAVHSVGF